MTEHTRNTPDEGADHDDHAMCWGCDALYAILSALTFVLVPPGLIIGLAYAMTREPLVTGSLVAVALMLAITFCVHKNRRREKHQP